MAAKPYVTRLELESGVNPILNSLCDCTGMTQVAVLSRIVAWWAGQPAEIQKSIIQPNAARDDHELAMRIIREWAKGRNRRN